MPLLDDDFVVFLYHHLGYFQFVGFQAVVIHQTYFRHDVELGIVCRFALAGHDMDMYRLVVVGIELESLS